MIVQIASKLGRFTTRNTRRVTLRASSSPIVCKNLTAKSVSKWHCMPEKPYYITTPIFYVNDAPHIGHLHSMVLADILKRWQILKGNKAVLCIGTDEHGIKIQRAAAQAEKPVDEFCDSNSEIFQKLASRSHISNNHFVRTTDPAHKDAVQYFWTVLKTRNMIYESQHQGWYCVSDETFYPENAIEKRLDPFTGRTFMASKETEKEVEWTNEKNYHFRLSEFQEPLLKFYQENPEFVVPQMRMKEVIAAVSSGLDDLSISRPVERLSWGIPVPDDESQTIYVWLDALINYLTKADYPWAPGEGSTTVWPADLHVIGKDIVRFHCIYWPAFLMAAGLKPPKQVLAHAHWTLGKRKIAKSTGNIVNPTFVLDRFGVDTIRFYLANDGGIMGDTDFGNKHIIDRYKKNLRGGLGNLLSRLTRTTMWNVKDSIIKYQQFFSDSNLFVETNTLAQILDKLPNNVNTHMDNLNVRSALHCIIEVVHKTNFYFQECKPWELSRSYVNPVEISNMDIVFRPLWEVIYHCAEALRIVGILIQPYMPTKATQMLDMLNVDENRRSFKYAKYGADFSYGNVLPTLLEQMLFPRLAVED